MVDRELRYYRTLLFYPTPGVLHLRLESATNNAYLSYYFQSASYDASAMDLLERSLFSLILVVVIVQTLDQRKKMILVL